MKSEDYVVHDFDPSGDEHPDYCTCPCCDLEDDFEEDREDS